MAAGMLLSTSFLPWKRLILFWVVSLSDIALEIMFSKIDVAFTDMHRLQVPRLQRVCFSITSYKCPPLLPSSQVVRPSQRTRRSFQGRQMEGREYGRQKKWK